MVRLGNLFGGKVLWIAVLLLGSAFSGLFIGKIINPAAVGNGRVIETAGTPAPPSVRSWSGVVQRIEPASPETEASFKLVDRDGAVLAYLRSTKIDLKFVEGMSVDIEGRRLRVVAADQRPLIQVEKVKFK